MAWLLHAWLIKITFQRVAARKGQIDGQDDIGKHDAQKNAVRGWMGGCSASVVRAGHRSPVDMLDVHDSTELITIDQIY